MLKFIKQDWLELQPSGLFGLYRTEQNTCTNLFDVIHSMLNIKVLNPAYVTC